MAGQPLCPMIVRVGTEGAIKCTRRCVRGADRCASHGGIERSRTPEDIQRRPSNPRQRCTAHRGNGEPCRSWAIKGGSVCRAHGGALPRVKKAARERLLELVEPALVELNRIVRNDRTADGDKLRAIQMILDRTGYGPKSSLELTTPAWENLINVEGILVDAPVEVVDAEVVESDEDRQIAAREAELAAEAEAARPDAEVWPLVKPDKRRPNGSAPPAHVAEGLRRVQAR